LAALQGEVLGVHNQGDGTYAVDVLVNGGVAIYKDLQKPNLQRGQILNTGALIGTIGISGENQGLHFTMLRGGRGADTAYRGITSAIAGLDKRIEAAYEAGRSTTYINGLYQQQHALQRKLTPDRFYTRLSDTPVGNCR